MKAQIEQYNKKKNANNSTPNLSTNISHHSTHTAKHEAKNPNNTHHLVLANSTTQMSSLAVVDCYILHQMGTQLNHVHVLSHLVGRGLLPQLFQGIVHRLSLVIVDVENLVQSSIHIHW